MPDDYAQYFKMMKYLPVIMSLMAWLAADAQSGDPYSRWSVQVENAATREEKVRHARIWLQQARIEHNYVQEVAALREVMFNDSRDVLVAYADSLLTAAMNTKQPAVIGQAYLTKGIAHYNQNQHAAALNAYMKADEYLAAAGSDYDRYKLKYAIGNTKYYLGFYHEAITLFEQCFSHYSSDDARGYLNAIYSLSLCYNRLGDYEKCAELNALGLAEEARLDNDRMHFYFVYSSGINDFYLHRYNQAIDELSRAVSHFGKIQDPSNSAVAWFYLGKSHLALGRQERALEYFEKVDASFHKDKYVRPDLRQTYEIFIDHYHKIRDYKSELRYIRRLKSVDSILGRDYKYLSTRLTKEYDTRKLNSAYSAALRKLRWRNILDGIGAFGFVAVVAFVLFKYFRLQRYHRNYKKLMAQPVVATGDSPIPPHDDKKRHKPDSYANTEKSEKELNPSLVKAALENIAKFEQEKGFRDSAVGMQELAEIMGTNTTYSRIIIQKNRNKEGIVDYLRDLRLNFVVEMLRTSSRFRNYTDEALAEECGFGSTQNFTRAFRAKFDMPPRFFIKQLKKDLGEENGIG